MKAERLKGLTDAVIAITMTIAVLELEIPKEATFDALLEQWPNFSAHFISFFIIYLSWFNHNRILAKVDYVSTRVFIANGVWLSLISIIPFATLWVGVAIAKTLPELMYACVLFACVLTYQVIFELLKRDHPEVDWKDIYSFRWRVPSYIGFVIAIIISFVMPRVTLLIITMIVIVNLIEILKIRENK